MASQSRGQRPATAGGTARARHARRESYPALSPQSSLKVGPASGDNQDFSGPWETWPKWTREVRFTVALDPEGGTP